MKGLVLLAAVLVAGCLGPPLSGGAVHVVHGVHVLFISPEDAPGLIGETGEHCPKVSFDPPDGPIEVTLVGDDSLPRSVMLVGYEQGKGRWSAFGSLRVYQSMGADWELPVPAAFDPRVLYVLRQAGDTFEVDGRPLATGVTHYANHTYSVQQEGRTYQVREEATLTYLGPVDAEVERRAEFLCM